MKTHKVPMRRCVVSKTSYPKNELTRIVCNKDGEVSVDVTGKLNGRGAYIKLSKENIKLAKKNKQLDRTLNVTIDDAIYTQLEELCDE